MAPPPFGSSQGAMVVQVYHTCLAHVAVMCPKGLVELALGAVDEAVKAPLADVCWGSGEGGDQVNLIMHWRDA
jgi:hypothetical protein